jgi:hypothetical protein
VTTACRRGDVHPAAAQQRPAHLAHRAHHERARGAGTAAAGFPGPTDGCAGCESHGRDGCTEVPGRWGAGESGGSCARAQQARLPSRCSQQQPGGGRPAGALQGRWGAWDAQPARYATHGCRRRWELRAWRSTSSGSSCAWRRLPRLERLLQGKGHASRGRSHASAVQPCALLSTLRLGTGGRACAVWVRSACRQAGTAMLASHIPVAGARSAGSRQTPSWQASKAAWRPLSSAWRSCRRACARARRRSGSSRGRWSSCRRMCASAWGGAWCAVLTAAGAKWWLCGQVAAFMSGRQAQK